MDIKIKRAWSMPSGKTFSIKPIESFILKTVNDYRAKNKNAIIIDPFCGGRTNIADINNDLDPDKEADCHVDALEFLKMFKNSSVDGVLFDPPYSPRQISEIYRKLEKTVNMETTQGSFWSKMKAEIMRIVKPNGFVFVCGWNSGGIGMKYDFNLNEILLVAHGGWHNDTIVTLEYRRPDTASGHVSGSVEG